MMQLLKLLPNPYTYVDHAGRLAGTCPMRPDEEHNVTGKVAARVHPDVKAKKNPVGGLGTGNTPIVQDTIWQHDAEPAIVENSADGYYLRAVMCGDLFAADAATAKILGIPFKDPAPLLQAARDAAIATYVANFGEKPAFAASPCPVLGASTPPKPSTIVPTKVTL